MKADSKRTSHHVGFVPGTEVAVSFDHLVGALLDGQVQHQ